MRFRRRRRRWWWPAIAVLSLVALFGAASQADLDIFRGRAVDAVSTWLDQPVTLGGRLGFRLIDGPALVLSEFEIGDQRLTAREARIAVRFWPLVFGRFEPRAISLVEPRFRLEGLSAWRAAPAGAWPVLPFERLDVQDGMIETADGGRIEQVSMTVVPGSPTGPLDVRSTGRRGGELFRFEGTLGRFDTGRPTGFAVKLQGAGIELAIAGAANRGADGLEIGGPLRVTAADGAGFLARFGIVGAPISGPAAADAKLAWSGGRLVLSDLTVEAGATRATGRIDLADRFGAGEVQLAFGRLDLDAWAGVFGQLMGGADERDFSLLLSAEAAGVRGGLARQVRAELRMLHRQMVLRQFSALLPGGTEVTASGRIDSSGARPVYEGEIDISSDNLRLALAWLGLEPTGVAPERLRRAALSGRLTFDGDRLTLPSFDLKLDTSRMLGSGNFAFGPSPRIDLRLAVDRMTLDPYQSLLVQALRGGIGGTVAASADFLTWHGAGLRDVELDLVLGDPKIELRRLRVAEAAGARFTATGQFALGGGDTELSFDMTTRRPSDLIRLFGITDNGNATDTSIIAAAGKLQGALTDLLLSGAVVGPRGTAPLDGNIRFTGDSGASFEAGPALRTFLDDLGAAASR